MTIVIDRYKTVLDAALPVIDELANAGEAKIAVPIHPDALGLAVDIDSLIYNLNSFVDTNLYLPQSDQPINISGNSKNGIRNYSLKIFPLEGRFWKDPPVNLEERTLIYSSQNDLGKISVDAYATRGDKRRGPTNPMVPILKRNGIELPEALRRIALHLSYSTMSPDVVNLAFSDIPPTRLCSTDTNIFPIYPVSEMMEHDVNSATFRFICEPLFWISWGQYTSWTISLVAKETTEEEISNKYSQPVEKILEHTQKARDQVYRIIEARVLGNDFDEVFALVKCPPQHAGKYIRNIIRALSYTANPDNVGSTQVENLVMTYNKEYAAVYGKPPITAEQLCNPPRRMGRREDRQKNYNNVLE